MGVSSSAFSDLSFIGLSARFMLLLDIRFGDLSILEYQFIATGCQYLWLLFVYICMAGLRSSCRVRENLSHQSYFQVVAALGITHINLVSY